MSLGLTPNRSWPESATQLATVEVAPGDASVDVFAHQLPSLGGAVDCWTFVSRGLEQWRQREIAFTVKREAGESQGEYPSSIVGLYSIIGRLAQDSKLVDDCGYTVLDPDGPGLLGRQDFKGIVYVTAEPLAGIPLPPSCLTGLVLTDAEMEVARHYGIVRVMALLGQSVRYFPVPPWADRSRAAVVTPDHNETVLRMIRRVPLRDSVGYLAGRAIRRTVLPSTESLEHANVEFADQSVVLELGPKGVALLNEGLDKADQNRALAVICAPDPKADCCLVWRRPGGPVEGIERPGTARARMSGNYIAFIAGRDESSVSVVEDGFCVFLTDADWSGLREALALPRPEWMLSPSAGMGFLLLSHSPS